MDIRPLHVGVSVADMDASIAWYREMLGFALLRREQAPPLKSEIAFLRNGDFEIELFRHEETRPLPGERRAPNTDIATQGTKHICFAAADFEGTVRALREKDADFALEPILMGEDRVCFIRDPSGVLIELMSVPAQPEKEKEQTQ